VTVETGEQLQQRTPVSARTRRRRLASAVVAVAACAGLFCCYLRLSATYASGSDAASNALEAWDLLHGNWLLHGWTLTDVSFYTTELPEFAAVELLRGLGPGAIHVTAALTYTLLVAVAALLARGRSRGLQGWTRALITAGIMIAPQLGNGVHLLLAQPDHVGTQVLVLGAFLLLDRAPRRWYTVAAVGALLTTATVADKITIVDAVVPLAFCALLHAVWTRRPLGHRFELSLAAAAAAGTAAALLTLTLLSRAGAFTLLPVQTGLSGPAGVPGHLALAWHGVLNLFGADVTLAPSGPQTLLTWLHAPGIALAVGAFAVVAWHLPHAGDLVSDVLTVAIVVNLAGFVASVIPATPFDTREMAALLPFGAVLAGRVFGPLLAGPALAIPRPRPAEPRAAEPRSADAPRRRRRRGRVRPAAAALALAGLGQLGALGYAASQPAGPDPEQALAGWLAAHHLTCGLGTFSESNITTVDSGGAVRLLAVSWQPPVRAVAPLPNATSARGAQLLPPAPDGAAVARLYQSSAAWYSPRTSYANFVVTGTANGPAGLIPDKEILALAGTPARTYHFQTFTIMVWNTNLLTLLGPVPSHLPGVIGHA
jgi:hypothetical protein